MIYSVRLQKTVPVSVECTKYNLGGFGNFIRYTVKDGKIPVGVVDLQDTINGVSVLYIKKEQPDLYRGFGEIADQIEVEHCLNKGITNPYINSKAALGSHIQHFKRGKRFVNEGVNTYLDFVVKGLMKGERVLTNFLGEQPMFMPQNLVQECMERIKLCPLLKK